MSVRTLPCIIVFVFLALNVSQAHAETVKGPSTGLPVPRFVSLKSSEVNVRTGPGTRYPIQWVYRRDNLPVEIIEEFDLWRKIRDIEGGSGWVHKSMLEGSRHAFIQGKIPRILRANPEPDARPLLKAEPMVVAGVMECHLRWCRVQIAGRKGWIEKEHLWGVYLQEVFD